MKELVVISGKGGTGKTSLTASFAALAGDAVIADCDVDASDLHLVLSPKVLDTREFRSGHEASIRSGDCIACGICRDVCRYDAVRPVFKNGRKAHYAVDAVACEGCGVCVRFCPEQAIDFPQRVCGEYRTGETRFGPMIYAQLGIGAENSGKLVSTVRKEARRIAEARGARWILVDGPPGIACPVIASITGSSLALIAVEPTLSGIHDMQRVLDLTRHFAVPAFVCVNKWELNPQMTEQIEAAAQASGVSLAGRIRYDRAVTDAQVRGITVVEYGGGAAEDIRAVWSTLAEVQDSRAAPAIMEV
ncbi:MAG: 4Fe-4S dicluster domain-containing protein [Acidobacteria bacterium]|nr:4Fe-4S dicluster domain-containing protein [Acidobacteriota bacterium]